MDHMKSGHSFASFGAIAKVPRSTLLDWVDKYEEFRAAKEVGRSYQLKKMEELGFESLKGDLPNGKPAPWIFMMKNFFGWSDNPDRQIPETKITLNYDLGED